MKFTVKLPISCWNFEIYQDMLDVFDCKTPLRPRLHEYVFNEKPPGGTLKIFDGVFHFLDFNDSLL